MKNVIKWIINFIILFLIFAIISSVFSIVQAKLNPQSIPSFLGFKPFVILSGSMRPFLEKDDIILVKHVKAAMIETGDIITFQADEEILVTHRVVDITWDENGNIRFKTKGDANGKEDHQLVREEQLIGKYFFNIPKGGCFAKFTQTYGGIILCIFLPVSLLVLKN